MITTKDEMQAQQVPIMAKLKTGAELEGTFFTHDPDSAEIVIRIYNVRSLI